MTKLDVSNSSTDSTSGSTSDSSSSGSSSSSSTSSSSDSESSACEIVSTAPAPAPAAAPAPTAPPVPKRPEEKPRRASAKPKQDSSGDDGAGKPAAATSAPVPSRRRSAVASKPKAAAAAARRSAARAPAGGKARPPPRPPVRPAKEARGAPKKKSIFSPDNSSESDGERPRNGAKAKAAPARGKGRARKASADKPKAAPATPDKKEDKSSINNKENAKDNSKENAKDNSKENAKDNSKENAKRRSGSRTNGPPAKVRPSEDKPSAQRSASSASSSRSSVDTDSPDSDSEPSPKKEPPATKAKPTPNKTNAKNAEATGDSGENVRIDAPEASLPRKLTRSLSARNMRLLASRSRATNHTDTDSDEHEKPTEKPSGQGKRGRRPPAPTPRTPPAAPQEPQERRCPVRDCDSTGHLSGKLERHFTWDACPLYHNVTAAWCVAAAEEHAAAGAVRRHAAQQLQQRPRAQPSLDQRAYQLKVKDLRSKWKGPAEARERWAAAGGAAAAAAEGEEREPPLEGFAPDYDVKLFREAQAQAAARIEQELGDLPANRGTRFVVMGKYCMEVWYQSPYPGDAARLPRLYVCEFCLSHHKSQVGIARHTAKCAWRHPPGDEVYRKGRLCVWQVDGRKHKQYCQQLCLLAKFFLDHKTLYYDVEPFLFYVMTLADREGCHTVGYFSKEKNSFLNYNVSCILTLPPYQRQGYGRLLIDFSYLLTKTEGKVGSPEKPLSDLGLISYRSYWKDALLRRLCSASGSTLCIRDLSRDLAVASYDIVSTLQERGLMKYWKGKHIVLKKQEVLEEFSRRAGTERVRAVDAACLRWTPPAAPPPPR